MSAYPAAGSGESWGEGEEGGSKMGEITHLPGSLRGDEVGVDSLRHGGHLAGFALLELFHSNPELQVLVAELRPQEASEQFQPRWKRGRGNIGIQT